MITSYLNILQDSLIKKIELLEQIEKKSLEQSEMIKGTNVDLELVDVNMDEKAKLIEEIVKLDNGFESIYVNAFDIETCEAMQQIANISTRAIMDELTFDVNDYSNMVKEQREMIVDYDKKNI